MSSYKIVFIGYRSRCQFAGHAFELRAAKPARENTSAMCSRHPEPIRPPTTLLLAPGQTFFALRLG
jgi:hypothetical protein